MIRPVLKNVIGNGFDLSQYNPKEDESFGIWVEMEIGRSNSEGADLFQLFVCNLDWLKENFSGGAIWLHACFIVEKFNFAEITKLIEARLSTINAQTWQDVTNQLRLIMLWEFEGYQK